MRRKAIISTAIIGLVLCISLLVVGVYASLNQTFSISNTIGFIPSEMIYVSLDCSVSGCKQANYTEPPKDTNYGSVEDYWNDVGIKHKVEFDSELKEKNLPQNLSADGVKWDITESLNFENFETPIVYKIVVSNYSNKRIKVYFSGYISNNSISNVASNDITDPLVLDGYNQSGDPATATLTLTTSVANKTKSFKEEPNNFEIIFTNYD